MPIPAEGRVDLRLDWNGEAVRTAEVRSRRPQPQRLLLGQPPVHARAVIPRLYSLCGDAQTVAVEALLGLVETGTVDAGRACGWAERIRLENLREHLWRLGLDWAAIAGEAPQPGPLRGLLAGREEFLHDPDAARAWARETFGALFGASALAWLDQGEPQAFDRWLQQAPTALAVLLRGLLPRLAGLGRSQAPLFRSADLEPLVQEVLPRLRDDPEFHWRPDWRGRVFEMGPLARNRERPLIAALLAEQEAADAWLRLVARVLELGRGLQSLAEGAAAAPALAWHRRGDEAVVALEMARGVLLHWIRVDQGRIRDYRIVAPTEWNFHPRGPAMEGLLQLRGHDERQLREAVTLQVMALDPCVQYQLEIVHA
ncbi:nickel-dependent hydrogenase large subunit [Thioalkalivibrio sp.]|uniref:nickel-dependent hydrogenase large subunit n=1 Tax=Thioalkalivibrio sp. TaxID=2093813 RepID=UPI0039767F20